MRRIEFKITYSGVIFGDSGTFEPHHEIIGVYARDINSGFRKVLSAPLALAPLGNGKTREIASIEFWQIP